MVILRIKRIDGRQERIKAGKLNKLFLKATYTSKTKLDIAQRNRIFNLSETFIKKGTSRFKDRLVPYEEWEMWFYKNLEKLDPEMFSMFLKTFGKDYFSQGLYTEPSWNVTGELNDEDDENDNAFSEIDDLFPDEFASDLSHQKKQQALKPVKKTRMMDTPRTIWFEWMLSLCFETFNEDNEEIKMETLRRLNYFFNKINPDVLLKKTPEEWYSWFLSVLPIMDRQEGLSTIARRLTYGLIKSEPSAWLMNTPMATRMKASFSLEKKYTQEMIVASKALVDPVWNSRTDLLIADGFPVKTLLFIYKDFSLFNSLENKLKIVLGNTPLLKATVQKVVSVDPLLLMTETPIEKSNYISTIPLKGTFSEVELLWNKAGDLLRSGHHVSVDVNQLSPNQWFQTSYADLIRQTTKLPTTLEVTLKHNHDHAERILSPTFGGEGWKVDISHESNKERLQRWLKASSQGRVTLELNSNVYSNAVVIGFNMEEFILLQLTDRDQILSSLASWSKGRNVIIQLLGLNQALKFYDEHKNKDINSNDTSYRDWLVNSLTFIKNHIHIDKFKDVRFGFIANPSWASYDFLNSANINNEKACRSVCNMVSYLKKKNIPVLTDLGMHTSTIFTLSMLEKAKDANVHQITKLDEISTLHVKF